MPVVQTVTGPVDPEELGFTLPHEHVFCDFWHIAGRFDYQGQTPHVDILAPEIDDFARLGGRTLVDLTVPGLGRDVLAVRAVAERTGVQIVAATGWYRQAYYPPEARIDQRSVGSLAEQMVAEIVDGIDGTGIRAGIIGEIGTEKGWISALEERVFRAAARAQRATGAALTTHALMSRVGVDQLRLLQEEGVDPARIIIGHCDTFPELDYYLEILEAGATVQFDNLGHPDVYTRGLEPRLKDLTLELLHRGKQDQLLLSQDVCYTSNLKEFGGNGYTYLQERFLPALVEAGVPERVIDTITVTNPRRLLSVAPAH